MARDRQRAKQRRRRQGGPGGSRAASRTPPARDIGLDDARVDDAGLGEGAPAPGPLGEGSPVPGVLGEGTPVPSPLEHASADVDEARLAEAGAVPPEVGDEDDLAPGVYEDELHGDEDVERAPDEAEADLVPAGAAHGEHHTGAEIRRRQRGRILTFLRHCVDELRRVQWPNRRQVGQATAVVLGFVVIAGGYLGLLDALWKPLIDAIL
jgi:preprotein translocase subunit SecE